MKKIKTGKVEIGPDEFNPKHGKFRVNMFVDLDVIDQIRKVASAEHMPYQTWINRQLRDLVEKRINSPSLTENDITRLVDNRIEQRVQEQALKKGTGR